MTKIDSLFTEKYDFYLGVATNILSAQQWDKRDAAALLAECYLYITEKKINGSPNFIDSVVINWMNKQVKWKNTGFQKKTVIKNNELSPNHYIIDEDEEEEDYEEKLAHLSQKYNDLDMVGKRLYHLAITGPHNNSGKLAKFLNLNRTTCYYMIKDMKTYLRDGYV